MNEETITHGWGFPGNANKAHYFFGPTSMCRKWLYTGYLEQGNDNSRDNCAACKKLLAKHNSKVTHA